MQAQADTVRTYLRSYMNQPVDHRADGSHWADVDKEVVRKKLGHRPFVFQALLNLLAADGYVELTADQKIIRVKVL